MTQPQQIPDPARFEVARILGSGAFGVAYEVFDRKRGAPVAMKVLWTHAGLGRFKQEFRALADVAHPNLVKLYELHEHAGTWFLTMELVPGLPFDAWLRAGDPRAISGDAPRSAPTIDLDAVPVDEPAPAPRRSAPADPDRSRAVLGQIARGLAHLHASGHLHRDLKPSNVLVTREGRAVVLDFGLVASLEDAASSGAIVGTPQYMAPEQATLAPVGPPADWYAFGTLLYEVLCGQLPYEGATARLLADKASVDPLPPSTHADGIPSDLDDLATRLLARDPSQRPGPDEILRILGEAPLPVSTAAEPVLVGREAELDALDAAWASVVASRGPALVTVTGASGMGKTELVATWLRGLAPDGPRLVLRGRCFEQESVPFKALDGIVEAIVRQLLRLGARDVASVLPRDAPTLCRLFPAFAAVPGVKAGRAAEDRDPVALRRLAIGALRELLARLGDRYPLIVHIDDLQWGDEDSARVLIELLSGSDLPLMLLILGYRSDEAAESACLGLLLPAIDASGLPIRHVALGSLPDQAALGLVSGLSSETAAAIVREAGGSPFLLRELARHGAAGLSLDRLVATRTAALPPEARQLVEAVALAGGPLPRAVAAAAADLGAGEPMAVSLALAAQLLRSRTGDALECYHSRLREAIVAGLADHVRVGLHRRLAEALIDSGGDDERIAGHLLGAGEAAAAAPYGLRAADRAIAALSFERAARLYGDALARGWGHAATLRVARAEALAHAGHAREAAQEWRAVVAETPGDALIACRAAEASMRAGDVDAGMGELRAAFAAAGAPLPASMAGSVVLLLRYGFGIWWSGYVVSGARDERAARIADLCDASALAVGAVGLHFLAAAVGRMGVWHALRSGYTHRAARALPFEAVLLGTGPDAAVQVRLRAAMAGLPVDWEEPALAARRDFAAMLTANLGGDFLGTERLAVHALERFDAAGEAHSIRRLLVQTILLAVRGYLGDWAGLPTAYEGLLAVARERNDQLTLTYAACGASLARLVVDQPDAAIADLRAIRRALWSDARDQQLYVTAALANALIYRDRGVGAEAWEEIESVRQYRSNAEGMLASPAVGSLFRDARARAALAARAAGADVPLNVVTRDQRALERLPGSWGLTQSLLVAAAAAPSPAAQAIALRKAAAAARTHALRAHEAAAAWRLATLDGDATAKAGAEAWFVASGVRAPERMVAMLIPGG